MKDIKKNVVDLNLLIDKRAKLLDNAGKRNYTHFNETAPENEKIMPQHLKVEFEIEALPADIVSDIRRIEMIGKAFGVTLEYIKTESDEDEN